MTSHSKHLGALLLVAVAASVSTGCAATEESDDRGLGEPGPAAQEDPLAAGTVDQAVANSCDTSSVRGLSLQIIAEGNCLKPGAYATVPKVGSVTFGANVFARLQAPGRDQLVAALNANPSKALGINSMLRTVAQQYLLYRWYQLGRCGIQLAATPGNSNHETGLALDTSQYNAWKSILQARGFRWLGSSDPVHFDYVGSGVQNYKGLDVKAFQRLWNRNHPADKITEDGLWGPNTQARMKKSPASGFATGASCSGLAEETEIASVDVSSTVVASADRITLQSLVLGTNGHDDHAHEVLAGLMSMSAEATAAPDEGPTACDTCVASICKVDAACCDDLGWNETCVAHTQAHCSEACMLGAPR